MTVLADDDNGVLAKIPAEYIGRALDLMPDPQTASGSRGRERTSTMTRFNVRKFLAYRLLALAVGLQLPLAAIAEEGVMFENVPLALDKASALAIVRDALKFREWRITATDADSVTAKINAPRIESTIRIWLDGRVIRYRDDAINPDFIRMGRSDDKAFTPERWISFLREDIGAAMRPHLGSPAKQSPSERMTELKKLRDAGLISPEEFEKKRAEILKNL